MASEKLTIPIRFKDKHIVIGCILYGEDISNFRNIDLILDTGATISGISEDIAIELGYNPMESDNIEVVSTAGGNFEMPLITVNKIDIAGSEYKHFMFLCNKEFNERFIDGVLGLDFLMVYNSKYKL